MLKKINLKSAVEQRKLICFADEIFLMPHSVKEAELLISDIESPKTYGLQINKPKPSQILNPFRLEH